VGVPARLPVPFALLLIAAGCVLCWLAAYLLGGAGHVGLQWFYLPIIVAAVRFGYRGALWTAVLSSVLAGPLMPQDVASSTPQDIGLMITRSLFFVLIGLVVAALVSRLQESFARDHQLSMSELELANRKAAFVAAVSQEFRSPLTALKLATWTLGDQDLVVDAGRELLEGMQDATERLEALISAVLAAAEADDEEPLRVREVQTSDLIRQVLRNLRRYDAESRVVQDIAPSADQFVTEQRTLERLLMHLLDNALKYSPKNVPVRVWAQARGRDIEITVIDEGPGFDVATIRQPFDTAGGTVTSGHDAGLGFGLFAARQLASRLGGRLEIASRPGKGTECRLTLPPPSAP
jgi:two-component system sensor histidine kinase KdpD